MMHKAFKSHRDKVHPFQLDYKALSMLQSHEPFSCFSILRSPSHSPDSVSAVTTAWNVVSPSFTWLTVTHPLRLSLQVILPVRTKNSLDRVGHSHLCADTKLCAHVSCRRTFSVLLHNGACFCICIL